MTDPDRDRGAYTPSGEEPFAFDPRNQDDRGAGRPPTTLVVSALVLMVLVIGLFVWMYRGGARRPGQPPVVGAPLSDIKQAPPASAQPTDEAAGLQIYSAEQSPQASSAPPNFAPPPEQPLPRLPPPPTAAPAAPPEPAPAAPAQATAATGPIPAPAPPRTVKPAPAPAPAPAAAAAAAGGALVQIGAFSSPGLADKGWNDIARLMPGDMVGKTKRVEAVAKDTGVLYRAYVGGFATKAEAAAFCQQLKAANRNCIVK